jgi:membrane-bound lytic murein transglycosylase B
MPTRLVQQILGLRGFHTGGIDGHVGPKTQAAIAAFQRAQGAAPAGVVDATLLGALLAGD